MIVVCGLGGGSRVSSSSGSGTNEALCCRPKLGLFDIATVAKVEAVASFVGTARASLFQKYHGSREAIFECR